MVKLGMAGKEQKDWERIKKDVVDLLRQGLSVEAACAYVGINKSSLYRKMKRDPDFATEIERAKEYFEAWVETKRNKILQLIIKKKDYRTALRHLEWLSETRLSKKYSKRQVVEHEGEMVVRTKEEIFEAMQNGIKPENEDDKSTPDNKTKEHD